MTVIETVRPGVQFIPDAAAAFRRADAQVRAEFGRGIDVNSTYRSWADQMVMFINWGRYVAGTGPHPGHSKAVHPSESFHVAGIALDSDDWRTPRIVAILAENGFIRNRLYVKNENHHFEWLRNRDQNYGKPIGGAAASTSPVPEEDDMIAGRITDGQGRNHHVIIGNGSLRHLIDSDDPEWMKNVTTADDKWTPIPIDRLPSVLRSYSCDLHIWDIRNGSFVVLDPITGDVAPGMLWSAVNVLRSTVAQIKVTSEQTKAYVEQLAKEE